MMEIRVSELRQLFNVIDPSPFGERDLDPRAEDFIVAWSRDLPADAALALLVHVEQPAGPADEAVVHRDAIRRFFRQRSEGSRRDLRELFRRGRISLAIALAFLAISIVVGDRLAAYFQGGRLADVLREGFLIGGWVAMWRPLEVFLYDWWPIRAEARLFERLSAMPVSIEYTAAHDSGGERGSQMGADISAPAVGFRSVPAAESAPGLARVGARMLRSDSVQRPARPDRTAAMEVFDVGKKAQHTRLDSRRP